MNIYLMDQSLDENEIAMILKSVANQHASNVVSLKKKSLSRKSGHVDIGYALLDEYPSFAFNGRIYCYKHGIYIPEGKRILRKAAQDILEDRATTKNVNEVVNWIERKKDINQEEWLDEVNPDVGYLNVNNGLLNWRTGELIPHSPDMCWTMQIPVNYDPAAKCPQIDLFLKCLVPQDTVPVLEELIGYCLLPTLTYQKAFLLKGKGSNGKSTFLELLCTFVGSKNVSHVSIHDLESQSFARANLVNKLVNSYDDLKASRIKDTDVFKILTNGEPIEAEFKGKIVSL